MQWQAKLIQHKNENRIAVYFDNTAELNARIKKLPDAKWSNTLKAWHVPDTVENRKRFQLSVAAQQSSLNTKSLITDNRLPNTSIQQIERFKQWMRIKRYSESTINT